MLVLVIILGAVVMVHVLLAARESARDAVPEPIHEPDAVTPHEVASVAQQRRRRIRDSLTGFVGSARQSWRLFNDDRMSNTVSGEIVSATKLAPHNPRPPASTSTPPPAKD